MGLCAACTVPPHDARGLFVSCKASSVIFLAFLPPESFGLRTVFRKGRKEEEENRR